MSASHNVRIERRGETEPLTPRFVSFLVEALGGQSLDDIQDSSDLRADYACLRGLLAVEVKSLEDDGSARMDNLVASLESREDWPSFFGKWPTESVLRNLTDRDNAAQQMSQRFGRAIVNHLKKANRQLEAHSLAFPRKNLVRLVVIVNEDQAIYEPQSVAHTIGQALSRMENDRPRYPNIDAVLFITERHAAIINGTMTFPIVIVGGKPLEVAPWKEIVLRRLLDAWAAWTGAPAFEMTSTAIPSFTTIEHIPDRMRRQDLWRLEYRRAPYMRSWTDNQLRDRWDDVMTVNLLSSAKTSPMKSPLSDVRWSFEVFAHLMEEVALRGLPLPFFKPTRIRVLSAAQRVGASNETLEWLEGFICNHTQLGDRAEMK